MMVPVSCQEMVTLTSSVHDTGSASDFGDISWTATVPAGMEIRFQVATNSDNATWDFTGPDGTAGSYYTASGTDIRAGHDGDRFIRYKVFLGTADMAVTPVLHDITIDYGQSATIPVTVTDNATLVEETTAALHGVVVDDGGEECQYRFEYGTVSGSYTADTGWSGNRTAGEPFSADVTGLGKWTKYYYRAQVKNSAGTAGGGELALLTKPAAPVDSSFMAVAAGATQIELTWAKGEGAQRTLIRRKTGGYPADRTDGVQVYFDTGTSYTDTELSPATTYYYRAWSQVSGSEQWSDGYTDASATTTDGPVVPPVAVGGTVYRVDKAQVLAPWLALFLVLSLSAGSVVMGLMRRG